MKPLVWFVFIFVIVAMIGTGFFFLTDAHLFDFWSNDKRSRWKRSHQSRIHATRHDRLQLDASHTERSSDNQRFGELTNYPQMITRSTTFPPDHFINRPYFELKPTVTFHDIDDVEIKIDGLIDHEFQESRDSYFAERTTRREILPHSKPASSKRKRWESLNRYPQSKAISRRLLPPTPKSRRGSKTNNFDIDIHERYEGGYHAPQHDNYHHAPQHDNYHHGPQHHHRPPVYFIPNHKEKSLAIVLKAFLLAILIPLGIAIALAAIVAFSYLIRTYGSFYFTVLNGTNTTTFYFNGLGGLGGLFGLTGLSGLGSTAVATVAQQQQQQQNSNNNNNNNNDNNNNAVLAALSSGVFFVNLTGRANDEKLVFRNPLKFKQLQDDQEGVLDDY